MIKNIFKAGASLGVGSVKAGLSGLNTIGRATIGSSKFLGNNIVKAGIIGGVGSAVVGSAYGKLVADADGQQDASKFEKNGALIGLGVAGLGGASTMGVAGLGLAGATVTGLSALGQIGKSMVKTPPKNTKVTLSNIGENYKLNKPVAVPLLVGAAAVGGIRSGIHAFEKSRMGTHDGRFRNATPDMTEFMNQSSAQKSYLDNAGATGDLVFALRR